MTYHCYLSYLIFIRELIEVKTRCISCSNSAAVEVGRTNVGCYLIIVCTRVDVDYLDALACCSVERLIELVCVVGSDNYRLCALFDGVVDILYLACVVIISRSTVVEHLISHLLTAVISALFDFFPE